MNDLNLNLLQEDCLRHPRSTKNWPNIVAHSSILSNLLRSSRSAELKSNTQTPELNKCNDPDSASHNHQVLIPWSDVESTMQDKSERCTVPINSFFYDCSYVSPFIRNIYSREYSHQGWYRWIGPKPVLEINLPCLRRDFKIWQFTIEFHSFLEEAQSKNIVFEANGLPMRLDWSSDLIYNSILDLSKLPHKQKGHDEYCLNLTISVPSARQASEQDKRQIAFAVRLITMKPA